MYKPKPIDPALFAIVAAADTLTQLLDAGRLCDPAPGQVDAAVQAFDQLQTARDRVVEHYPSLASPFLRYRAEIMAYTGDAERLRRLVLHLHCHSNDVNLGQLLWHADDHHRAIAVDLIESYSRNGENDGAFMALAREIHDLEASHV